MKKYLFKVYNLKKIEMNILDIVKKNLINYVQININDDFRYFGEM